MRLLILAASLEQGGAETHVCALATELAKRGHTVTVASAGGGMAALLEREGIRHRTLDWNTHAPWRLLRARRSLKCLLRRDSFDLIHAHARIPAALAAPLARRYGIPLVTTAHARFRVSRLYRRLCRWGMGTVAVGEDIKQYLCEEYAVSADNVRVIPNGVDTDIFSPTERKSDGTRRLVYLSRLDRDCSRVAFLLCDLAERLGREFPALRIEIVGGGECFADVKRRAEEINRAAGLTLVRMLGYRQDPQSVLQAADLFVGVSRAALEAMACEIPVILAGDEGFLGIADPDTVHRAEWSNFCGRGEGQATADGLYESIVALLSESDEERRQRGERLAHYVRTHHSVEKMTERTEAFYEDMLRRYQRMCQRGTVVLCGYYGYGNAGDNALLRAACERVARELPNESACALTRRGEKDSELFGIFCVRRSSPLAVRRALRNASMLVFGGGTLLQDTTSFRSLLYYCAVLGYARRSGLRIELWANGLSEPTSARAERMMRRALVGCDRVGLRDGASLFLAERLIGERGSPVPIRETDLAMSTPTAEPSRVSYLLHRYGLSDKPFAVVAVRGREPVGYLRIFSEWIATLPAEGLRLLFVPLFPEEDEPLSLRWSESMKSVLARGLSPSDLIGIMKEARIVCGMRLHALVFAASARTPFVGFGGDGKIESFCRENGGVYFTELYGKR